MTDTGDDFKEPLYIEILVEEEFKHYTPENDSRLSEAILRVRHRVIGETYGWVGCTFGARYHALTHTICITGPEKSGNIMFLDPHYLRGHGLGSYLQSIVNEWAKQWEGAKVDKVSLSDNQAEPENLLRRNTFYENQGLEFDYWDENHQAGSSKEMLVEDLVVIEKRETLVEIPVDDLFKQLDQQELELSAAARHVDSVMEQLDYINNRTVSWLARRFLYGLESFMRGWPGVAILAGACWYFWGA